MRHSPPRHIPFARYVAVIALALITPLAPAGAADPATRPTTRPAMAPDAPLRVHVVSGSKEYQSEPSLREFTADLARRYRITFTASWGQDGGASLDGLDGLPRADLLLIFARRMKLPDDQMKLIRAHWEAGKPIVGIRTASHAFQPADNDVFDRQVLGGTHQSHWGDEPLRVTNAPDHADHPVLRGVAPFASRKLYKRGLLPDAAVTVLQTGDNGKDRQPVTLVRTHNGGRVFYTSLGVPEDFRDDNFRRLLTNAIFWTTHRDPAAMKR